MTRLLAAVAVVALAVPALAQPKDAPAAAKALNGSYTLQEVNFDGKPAPAEVTKPVTGVDIKDGTITVRSAKNDAPAKFTIDATMTPATIDIVTKEGEKAKLGLYKVEKGELTIVFSDTGPRPTDFSTGDGLRKMVLVKKEQPKKTPQ
jgi:uncharacterized protein (TIGR03067 family)